MNDEVGSLERGGQDKTRGYGMKDSWFFTEKMNVGYHGETVVKDVEFSLPRGEILTLIGPNGAGKSTILKSIAGQLSLISGTVVLDGTSLSQVKAEDLAKVTAKALAGIDVRVYPYTVTEQMIVDGIMEMEAYDEKMR